MKYNLIKELPYGVMVKFKEFSYIHCLDHTGSKECPNYYKFRYLGIISELKDTYRGAKYYSLKVNIQCKKCNRTLIYITNNILRDLRPLISIEM